MGRITVSQVGLEWLMAGKPDSDQATKASEVESVPYQTPANRRAVASSPDLLKTSLSALPSLKDSQQALVTSPNDSILERSHVLSFSSKLLGSPRSENKSVLSKSKSASKAQSASIRNKKALEESSQKFVILKKKLEVKAQIKFFAPDDPSFLEKFQVAPLPESLAKIRKRSKAGKMSIHVLRQSAQNPYREYHTRIPGSLTSLNPFKGHTTRGGAFSNESIQTRLNLGSRSKPTVVVSTIRRLENPSLASSSQNLFRIQDFRSTLSPADRPPIPHSFGRMTKALVIQEPSATRST